MKKSIKFSPEFREGAVRMVTECRADHPSLWLAVESIAAKIGCTAQTLLTWVRQHERDSGQREGPTTADQKRVKELEREVKALLHFDPSPMALPGLQACRVPCGDADALSALFLHDFRRRA